MDLLNANHFGELGFLPPLRRSGMKVSSGADLREICGFQECTSLCRIELPSSVETIMVLSFRGCTSLNEVIFSSDSHLREIDGFRKSTSLRRIEIPSSVEKIPGFGFHECTSLNEIILSSDSHLR
jgi:hypothetical protein